MGWEWGAGKGGGGVGVWVGGNGQVGGAGRTPGVPRQRGCGGSSAQYGVMGGEWWHETGGQGIPVACPSENSQGGKPLQGGNRHRGGRGEMDTGAGGGRGRDSHQGRGVRTCG